MFPILTNGGGQCMAFPDVCKTPTPAGPVPIPYPNIAQGSDAEGSKKVKILNKEVLRKGDQVRMSAGDEAGSAQGVVSSKIKGKAEYMMGWPKVKAEGKEVAHLTVPVGQNAGSLANAPGGIAALHAQLTVKVFMKLKMGKKLVAQKYNMYKKDPTDPNKDPSKKKDWETTVPPTKTMHEEAAAACRSRKHKNICSERLGDHGGRRAAEKMAESHQGIEEMHSFSFSGAHDLVAVCGDRTVIVMECKGVKGGGEPRYGTRKTRKNGRCQQGTPGYLGDITEKMAGQRGSNKKRMAVKIQKASHNGKLIYASAATPYDPPGKAGDTVVKVFDP